MCSNFTSGMLTMMADGESYRLALSCQLALVQLTGSRHRIFNSEDSYWLLNSEYVPSLFSSFVGSETPSDLGARRFWGAERFLTERVEMLVEGFKDKMWKRKRKSRNSQEGSGQVFMSCWGVFGSMAARWDFTSSFPC